MASGSTPIYSLPYPVLSDPVLIVEDLLDLATATEGVLLTKVDNPMTTVGDLILGGTAGIPTRLPIGPNGYTLSSNGTTASWNPSIQGITGMQGTQGVQGTQGLQGPQGTQGVQGLQGVQGPQGTQGVQGLQGLQGFGYAQLQGVQGTQGLQGTQGTNGIQGTQGLLGLQGSTGPQGTQGITGLQGITGTQGTQGLLGLQGTTGATGLQGTTGTTGLQGLTGLQGIQGIQGVQGVTFMVENAQTGTTFTPVLGDASKMITLSNAAAIAVSIPRNSDVAYPLYTEIHFEWEGVGQPTISAAFPGTTTILSNGTTAAAPKLRARYSAATAWKIGTDSWRVFGDIS